MKWDRLAPCPVWRMTSGAIQWGVPVRVYWLARRRSISCREHPKSACGTHTVCEAWERRGQEFISRVIFLPKMNFG